MKIVIKLDSRTKIISLTSIISVAFSFLLSPAVQAENNPCKIVFPYKYDRQGSVGSSNRSLGPISALTVSPNGRTLVISTQTDANPSARQRRLQQQLIVSQIGNKDADQMIPTTHNITSVTFHPNGRFFAAAATGRLKIFNTNNLRKSFDAPAKQIMLDKISFSPDGSHLLSLDAQKYSDNKNIVLYRFNGQELVLKSMITEPDRHYTAATFHPDGNQLILGGLSDTGEFVEVRSLQTGSTTHQQNVSSSKTVDAGVSALAISPDGKTIAVASRYHRHITILKSDDLSTMKQFSNPNVVRDIAFSPNGKYLLTGEEASSTIPQCDSPAKLWSLESGSSFALLERKKDTGKYVSQVQETVRSVLFSTDGRSIFLGSNDQYVNHLKLDDRARSMLSQ
jgi:WD40 repeat protein